MPGSIDFETPSAVWLLNWTTGDRKRIIQAGIVQAKTWNGDCVFSPKFFVAEPRESGATGGWIDGGVTVMVTGYAGYGALIQKMRPRTACQIMIAQELSVHRNSPLNLPTFGIRWNDG
ncbi:hypothetical protein [Bradyrhizobium prioriisuperbiae]|uniref:hypothetical protein n=1 Tax=Bradyrhizobium prioriisuperbiae TaxID=2854389 RepID=UPI0028F06393|nr:hypothetical protein [Bradyrhizobium prioritasuperba]